MGLKIEDNSEEIKEKFDGAILRALERMGLQAEGYAVDLSPPPITGALRNSITHIVDAENNKVYIGSNLEYAPYVELGTGIYAEGGGGRPTPWVYQDSKGNWHHTRGQEPQPYLRPAITDHKQTYWNILRDELENAE